MPNFEVRGNYIRDLTSITQVGLIPLVSESMRLAYEEYTLNNIGWIRESMEVQKLDASMLDEVPNLFDAIYHARIRKDGEIEAKERASTPLIEFGPADYAPVWQIAPVPRNPEIINYDLFQNQEFSNVYYKMWGGRTPQFSSITDLAFYLDAASGNHSTNPHSFFLFPIYSDLFSHDGLNDADDLVAVVMAVFSWNHFFEGILQPGEC
jgi:hypothetical protein